MKILKRLAAFGAAAALTLSLTACSSTDWVYESGDYSVSSGVYLGYLTQSYLSGQSDDEFNSEIENIWKQNINGMSYKDYCIDSAEHYSERYLAIAKKFDEMNLSLSDEDNQNIDTQVYYLWNLYGYQQYFQPNGTSAESFRKLIESGIKEDAIFNAYYNKGGIEAVDEKEIENYLRENYVDANYFTISFADDEGNSLPADQVEALKEKAEDYAKRINEKKNTFNEVKTEYSDEQAKEEAEENDEEFTATDPDSIGKDEETKSLIPKSSTSLPEDFVNALFNDAKEGEATVLTIDKTYYVVVKYDLDDDLEDNVEDARDTILAALKNSDFEKMVSEWVEALEVNSNSASLRKYSPKNIKEPETAN